MEIFCRLLFFLVGLLYTSAADEFFTENPMDITVTLGGDAHFWCATNDYFACYNMNWLYAHSKQEGDPLGGIGTCTTPGFYWDPSVNERLALSFEGGRFGLHISNVSYNDSGRYGCWVARSNPDGVVNEISNVAFLTVISPVPTPLCRSSREVVTINDKVQLICQVPRDSIIESVKLTWTYESIRSIRTLLVGRGLSYATSHTFTETDNYRVFTCVAGSNTNNGPNCTLSPLQIPMTVETTYILVDNDLNETKAIFYCNANAVPPVTSYRWSILETDSTSSDWKDVELNKRQISQDGRTLLITIGRDHDRRLSVTCLASNTNGLTNSSEPVTVLVCSSGTTVTDVTLCDVLPTSSSTTESSEESTVNDGTGVPGGPLGADNNSGVYVWIGVATLILIAACIVACILVMRYRRSKAKSKTVSYRNGHRGQGVVYSANSGSVDVRSHTGTSESNVLMMAAEHEMATPHPTSQQDDLEKTHGDSQEGVAMNCALHEGETYASIDDLAELRHSVGDPGSDPPKATHDGHDTVGLDAHQPDGAVPENASSKADLSDSTYASIGNEQQSDVVRLPAQPNIIPCVYESIDPNSSIIHSASRDTASLKKVCVVPPTCHLNDKAKNQDVYAMPDKTRKQKTDSKKMDGKPNPEPSGVVYAMPDKKKKKPVKKYGEVSSSDTLATSTNSAGSQNVPEGLYAMPDKSQNQSSISRLNSKDSIDGDSSLTNATAESDFSTRNHPFDALSRNNSIKPKKPHRTASSKVAGSRIMRDSLKRQSDSESVTRQSISRSSSTEMDNLEDNESAIYAMPDKTSTPSADPESSIPIYAMPDKRPK